MNDVSTVATDVTKKTDEFVKTYCDQIKKVAGRCSVLKGLPYDQFVVMCVKSDRWWFIANTLQQGRNWQKFLDRDTKQPIVIGSMTNLICEVLGSKFPNFSETLMKTPPQDHVKVMVLDGSGAKVHFVKLDDSH